MIDYLLSPRTSTKRLSAGLFCWFLFLFHSATGPCAQETPIPKLERYIANGAYAIEVGGKVVRSKNLHKKYIPASTIKIFTGLMALEILGPQYRFATRFYLDENRNLYVVGGGDPLLISESVTEIASQLSRRNVLSLNRIILDDSQFSLEGPPSGSKNSPNPYDAQSGALAVNFNALPFIVKKGGTILTGEQQTPLLPLMADIGKTLPPGSYRVNVSAFANSKNHSNILRYSGELFTAIFKNAGIVLQNTYATGTVPRNTPLIFTYTSHKTVSEAVRLSLYYSSNFIANQLYLSCGRRLYGSPASWHKAGMAVESYLEKRLGVAASALQIKDGSGLSSENLISAEVMLDILERFSPYAHLLRERNGVYVKSGTLTGVYSYAGYFKTDRQLVPYVIFLNQKRNNRKAVLTIMQKEVDAILAQQ